jgi:hypothetical protein
VTVEPVVTVVTVLKVAAMAVVTVVRVMTVVPWRYGIHPKDTRIRLYRDSVQLKFNIIIRYQFRSTKNLQTPLKSGFEHSVTFEKVLVFSELIFFCCFSWEWREDEISASRFELSLVHNFVWFFPLKT